MVSTSAASWPGQSRPESLVSPNRFGWSDFTSRVGSFEQRIHSLTGGSFFDQLLNFGRAGLDALADNPFTLGIVAAVTPTELSKDEDLAIPDQIYTQRQLQVYVHYTDDANPADFEFGLKPYSFATTASGSVMDAQTAQATLALRTTPTVYYEVDVTPATPVFGPTMVFPMYGQPGGGIQYFFPSGSPPGSVYGPFSLPLSPPGH
jgi:hypothetical protein